MSVGYRPPPEPGALLAPHVRWTNRKVRKLKLLTRLHFIKVSSALGMDFETSLWLSCNKPSHPCTRLSKDNSLSSINENDNRRESGPEFMPKFDDRGLVTAIVTDSNSGEVLMVASMNGEALALTQRTGIAHFWSRSRQSLWKKGETSGNTLSVQEILVDCDQDALVLRCKPAGPACHTGARSCFYRKLEDGVLLRVNS